MSSFATHNWDTDEEWKQFLKRIDIVGNEREVLEKAKKKYYQKYIDPNFGNAPQSPNTNTNTSHTSSTSSTNSSNNTSNNTSNSSQSRASSGPVFQFRMAWLLAHIFLLLNSVLYILPFFGLEFSYACYSRLLWSGIAAYAITLYNALGFPKFNREYASRLSSNDNTHYLFICASLLTNYPVTTMVFPLAIYSALNVAVFLTSNSSQIPPAARSIYTSYLEPYVRKLLQVKDRALFFGAYFEVASIALAIVNVLSGYAGLLSLLAFYWFLNFRYMASNYTQTVFHFLGVQLDTLTVHRYCPSFIRTVYLKIKGYLRNSIQARAQ